MHNSFLTFVVVTVFGIALSQQLCHGEEAITTFPFQFSADVINLDGLKVEDLSPGTLVYIYFTRTSDRFANSGIACDPLEVLQVKRLLNDDQTMEFTLRGPKDSGSRLRLFRQSGAKLSVLRNKPPESKTGCMDGLIFHAVGDHWSPDGCNRCECRVQPPGVRPGSVCTLANCEVDPWDDPLGCRTGTVQVGEKKYVVNCDGTMSALKNRGLRE